MARITPKHLLGLLAVSLLSVANAAFADSDKLKMGEAQSPLSAQYMPGARIMNDWTPPLQAWEPTQAEMKMLQADFAASRGKDRQKVSYANQVFTFKKITPCRLIDTRTAAQGGAVGSGGYLGAGTFTAGQTRSYTSGGRCGIQSFPGAIDLAGLVANLFAQPVGGTSGDIEAGSPITGGTVSLVYNGGNGNYQVAGTTITTSNSGSFSIANRFGSADVVVDLVGYFTDGNSAASTPQAPGDFFNDSGDAVKITGTMGVVGAGLLNNPIAASFAFKHVVVAGTFGSGGTVCTSTPVMTVINNNATNNNPTAHLTITPDFTGTSNARPAVVRYVTGTFCAPDGVGRWVIQKLDGVNHAATDIFNVLVVQPR